MRWLIQFYGLLALLVVAGVGGTVYKVTQFGLPFLPGEAAVRWVVEARVSFFATGHPVRVSLALPDSGEEGVGFGESAAALQYGFHTTRNERGENRRGIWTARSKSGPQVVYYRVEVDEERRGRGGRIFTSDVPRRPAEPIFEDLEAVAAQALVEAAYEASADVPSFLIQIMRRVNALPPEPEVALLLRRHERLRGTAARTALAIELCHLVGVAARVAHGVWLDESRLPQEAVTLLEVWDGDAWVLKLPDSPEEELPSGIFVWNRGGRPLLDVEGGVNSGVVFASARELAAVRDPSEGDRTPLLLTTVQSLPVTERAVFRFIVMVPIGALVVVVMRNVIGVSTLGTFMPVLLALSFLQMRSLAAALLLFGLVLTVGLYFRFLLSRLNLLVVPRVAACVVIVTLLMVITSVASYRLGFIGGMGITLFPMIILAWTIERMSLLWEEEGAGSALKQIVGSTAVAIVAYMTMLSPLIQHWCFYFPELLLLVLAAIILLGRYTGYRLLELVRFRHFRVATGGGGA